MRSVDINALPWKQVGEAWPGKVDAGEPAVRYKAFPVDSPLVPSAQLVEYEPGHTEAPHSHVESEIFYLVDGEMAIGDHDLAAGMLVHIPGGTVYGPSVAGPRGVRFLRLHLEG